MVDPFSSTLVAAMAYRESGRYQDAERTLGEYLQERPADARAIAQVAYVQLLQGRDVVAEATLARAEALARADPEVLCVRARVALKALNVNQASAAINAAVAADPNNPEIRLVLASVFRTRGDLDNAWKVVDGLLAEDENYPEALVNRAQLLLAQGNLKAAAADTRRALELKPHLIQLWRLLAGIYTRAGKSDDACWALEQYCAADNDDPAVLSDFGEMLRVRDRLDQSLTVLRRATHLAPTMPIAWVNYGNALQQSRDFQPAAKAYEKAVSLNPRSAEAHQNLGCALYEQRYYEEAISSFRHALALKADLVESQISLSRALLELGKAAEAILAAEAVPQDKVEAPAMQYSLAVVFARCGRQQEARALLEDCRRKDPNDRQGAGLFLAAMGFERMLARAPDALLDKLYADRARSWDRGTNGLQPYRGADLVAAAFAKMTEGQAGLDVLDAGCGTGLVGPKVRPKAKRLEGVDLSQPMLDQADAKNCYDSLERHDLVAYMEARPAAYDAIVSAATLIHFGDLRPVLDAAAVTLRLGGCFVFTVFPNEQNAEDVVIGTLDGFAQGGCFAHSAAYVVRIANATGFDVEAMTTEVHEHHNDRPKMGLVVALRRRALASSKVART
jgi:predicted TPR repeat methyltransferase